MSMRIRPTGRRDEDGRPIVNWRDEDGRRGTASYIGRGHLESSRDGCIIY